MPWGSYLLLFISRVNNVIFFFVAALDSWTLSILTLKNFSFLWLLTSSSHVLLYLMQPADIYLIDEPSAYLDSEQRIVASKVIKRFILHAKKTAFVVEHDFIMATYLADRVIVYEGKPSIDCTANCPQSLLTGMNLFLSVSVFFSCLPVSLSIAISFFLQYFLPGFNSLQACNKSLWS